MLQNRNFTHKIFHFRFELGALAFPNLGKSLKCITAEETYYLLGKESLGAVAGTQWKKKKRKLNQTSLARSLNVSQADSSSLEMGNWEKGHK